jgi:hypothetical protein
LQLQLENQEDGVFEISAVHQFILQLKGFFKSGKVAVTYKMGVSGFAKNIK